MELFLDSTLSGCWYLGLEKGRRRIAERVPFVYAQQEDVLLQLQRFLKRYGVKPSDLHALVVTHGPGRFTGLRVASVIANILHAQHGARLFAVRAARVPIEDPVRHITDMARRARSVHTLSPFYGKAPNITKPKRQKTIQFTTTLKKQ